jgi:hypothetical protein
MRKQEADRKATVEAEDPGDSGATAADGTLWNACDNWYQGPMCRVNPVVHAVCRLGRLRRKMNLGCEELYEGFSGIVVVRSERADGNVSCSSVAFCGG